MCLMFTQSGNTALSRAAAYGHADVARLLVATGGARIDVENNERQTPLHRCCRWGHADVVEVLVSAGAKVSAFDKVCLVANVGPSAV